MKFHKHPRKPSTYIAEDIDSGHRYDIIKYGESDWELAIHAGSLPTDIYHAGTKRELVERAQRHNARLWIDNMNRLHGKSGV